jgi:Prolyl oligopeptidase, N-terminal beta-propeller domain
VSRSQVSVAAPGEATKLPTLPLAEVLSPPTAKRIPVTLQQHGDNRIDDYYWIRDDSRSSKEVTDHLAAETLYTRSVLADTEGLQVCQCAQRAPILRCVICAAVLGKHDSAVWGGYPGGAVR